MLAIYFQGKKTVKGSLLTASYCATQRLIANNERLMSVRNETTILFYYRKQYLAELMACILFMKTHVETASPSSSMVQRKCKNQVHSCDEILYLGSTLYKDSYWFLSMYILKKDVKPCSK